MCYKINRYVIRPFSLKNYTEVYNINISWAKSSSSENGVLLVKVWKATLIFGHFK